MTFAPQPYERFVEDLVSALTGGLVREEHLFIGADASYSLAAPGCRPETLRVYGQRNQVYSTFEPGVDYTYEVGNDAVRWKTNGRPPDDHSYFYVNYYTLEAQARLTDRNPGSVVTVLAEAFAREYAVLHKQMEEIYRSAFVDLASNASLDHVAALLGVERKDARFAGGEVLFKRSTPAPADINLPSGTVVSTEKGQNFETTDRRTLRRGQLSVTAPVRAQVEGPAGRVERGAIVILNRPVFGVETVTNEAETFFANVKETDEELRRRIKSALERAGKSTLDAIKYSLVEDIPEITEENIQVSEPAEVPGQVDVRLGLAAQADPDLVRRVEASILSARPAGIRVTHNLASVTPNANRRKAEAEQARRRPPQGIPSALTGGGAGQVTWRVMAGHFNALNALCAPAAVASRSGEASVAVNVEVLLRLREPNLAASQKERIEEDVRQAVTAFIAALPMGAVLVYNKLLGRIVQADEVADARLLLSVPPGRTVYQENLETDGWKAQPGRVTVGLMEEVLEVTVGVLLAQAGQEPGGVTDALRQQLQLAVETVIAAANGRLERAAMEAAIRDALRNAGSSLALAGRNAVTLNVEYLESGRLLNNAAEVVLTENEVVRLKEQGLSVSIPGALDV